MSYSIIFKIFPNFRPQLNQLKSITKSCLFNNRLYNSSTLTLCKITTPSRRRRKQRNKFIFQPTNHNFTTVFILPCSFSHKINSHIETQDTFRQRPREDKNRSHYLLLKVYNSSIQSDFILHTPPYTTICNQSINRMNRSKLN